MSLFGVLAYGSTLTLDGRPLDLRPVVRIPSRCSVCGRIPSKSRYEQDAAFLFGGYGETKTIVVEGCDCESRVVEILSTRPRKGGI